MKKLFFLAALVSFSSLGSCSDNDRVVTGFTPSDTFSYKVPVILRQIPHDAAAFTQGLLYDSGFLYESTGLNCCSSIRKLDPSTGRIIRSVLFRTKFGTTRHFGEGIALHGNELVQLTWLSKLAFKWDIPDLHDTTGVYLYSGQGWGLTTDDTSFIMSNGTDTIYFRNYSFDITRKLPVTLFDEPVDSLNELEYVNGIIYANVLTDSSIYGINPENGVIDEIIDCSSLVKIIDPHNYEKALNGIAYNDSTGHFYITGKMWPFIFEVILEDKY